MRNFRRGDFCEKMSVTDQYARHICVYLSRTVSSETWRVRRHGAQLVQGFGSKTYETVVEKNASKPFVSRPNVTTQTTRIMFDGMVVRGGIF